MQQKLSLVVISGLLLFMGLASCGTSAGSDPGAYESYDIVSTGTRQFEWDTERGPGIIKILIEENNLGSNGAEIAEIWFPPGFEGWDDRCRASAGSGGTQDTFPRGGAHTGDMAAGR